MKNTGIPIGICLFLLTFPVQAELQLESIDSKLEISLEQVSITTQQTKLSRLFIDYQSARMSYQLIETEVTTPRELLSQLFLATNEGIFASRLTPPGLLPNESPRFLSLDAQQFAIGKTLTLQLKATDADGDPLAFSTVDLPAGALLSGSTFTWTPTADQIGTHTLNFTVSDGRGGTDSQTVQIVVEGSSGIPSLLGDLDGDGEVTSGDAILALRIAADILQPSDSQRLVADVDGDGGITSGDAILILRKAAGLIESFLKPVAVNTSLPLVNVRMEEGIKVSDGQSALVLTLDPEEGVVGGDLSLTLGTGFELSGAILLKGLSPEALSAINIDQTEAIRISFIDPGREEILRPLSLILPVENLEPGTAINVQGTLYNQLGWSAGEVRYEGTTRGTLPSRFVLHQNYPNPFNPSTTFRFALPQTEHATLDIYALTGQHVRKLIDEPLAAGVYALEWNGADKNGKPVGTGVYLYRLSIDDGRFTETRRMLLLK